MYNTNFRDNVGYENVDLGFSVVCEGGMGSRKGSSMSGIIAMYLVTGQISNWRPCNIMHTSKCVAKT